MNSSSPFPSPAYDLLPADIVDSIPSLGSTSEDPDPTLHVKWFTPDSGWTWYLAEYDSRSGIAYGFVVDPFPEWGTFGIHEIRTLRGVLNLPVERDIHFDACPLSKITDDSISVANAATQPSLYGNSHLEQC